MTPIAKIAERILEADRRFQAATTADDHDAWETAIKAIDVAETEILKLEPWSLLDAALVQAVLLGRIRRLRQDGDGSLEHEAEKMAAIVLDALLDFSGATADRPRALIQYAYDRWGPRDHVDPGP